MNKISLKKYLRKLGIKSISKKGDVVEIHVNSKSSNKNPTVDIFQFPFL